MVCDTLQSLEPGLVVVTNQAKPCDIELAHNPDTTAILVRAGYGVEVEKDRILTVGYVADNVYDAALLIRSILVGDENSR